MSPQAVEIDRWRRSGFPAFAFRAVFAKHRSCRRPFSAALGALADDTIRPPNIWLPLIAGPGDIWPRLLPSVESPPDNGPHWPAALPMRIANRAIPCCAVSEVRPLNSLATKALLWQRPLFLRGLSP